MTTFARQDRIDRRRHLRQVVEIFVDWFGGAGGNVTQNFSHAPFGLAGKQVNAKVDRFLQLRRKTRQHRDAAADMKTTHDDRKAERPELPSEVECARILIRLHADQADHAAAGGANALRHSGNIDDGITFVTGLDLDIDVGTEHAIIRALLDQPIDAGEAVRRQGRAQPLDHVAVPVVV